MEGRFIQALILGLATLAIGCGGTGGSQTQAPASQGAMVTLSGSVAGSSGSLAFAGQSLITAGALVTDQGNPAAPASIKPGTVILGTASKTSAGFQLQTADVRHAVQGPIASVDLTGSKLVVMGQTVMVDALTVIEQEVPGGSATTLTLADLKVGDLVEVDGTTNPDGTIQASRIEREPASLVSDLFLRGVVSALDTTAKTFVAGGFTVSYGTAMVTGTLANGAVVVIHGTVSGSIFTATRVRVQMDLDAPGSTLEVSGPITGLDSTAKSFMLLSYTVDYSKAMVKGTLANGAQVEVEGTLDTSGTTPILRASEVEVAFTRSGTGASNGTLAGMVTAVSSTDLTLTLGSVTFWTDGSTLIKKGWAAASLADVTVGSRVEIHFLSTKTNAAGQAYATKVEIRPF